MAAGYFPTPEKVVNLITSHLSPPKSGDFRWLDPCCGAGIALARLAAMLGGETYGIELDMVRSAAAARRLDHTLAGDFKAQRLPKDEKAGISVLFLNPPYDTDDSAGGRLELAFLRDTQDWLMAGGVLVYLIPQYRISGYIAKRLATHFRDVRIYRFPDPEFARFRQVVIFATKRAQPVKDDATTLEIAMAQKGALDTLPHNPTHTYSIPDKPEHPFYFRRDEYEPEEVLEELKTAGVWAGKQWADLLTPRPRQTVQPLMPLRRGHIAMVLAAGLLDNMTVQRGGTKLLVKGRLHKVQKDITDAADREKEQYRTREQFEASITTLDLHTGQVTTLADEGALRNWLTEWQDILAHKIVETFKPLHCMNYDGLPGFDAIIATHSRFRRLPGRSRTGLFEAQKQVTAALLRRFMAGEDFAILQATMGTGKTTVALSLADCLKKYYGNGRPFPVIVTCPPHLVEKWIRETREVIPMAHAMEVRRPGDLDEYVQNLQNLSPGTLSIAVVSSEMLKLGSGWAPAVIRQPKRYKRLVSENVNGKKVERIERLDTFACPKCGQTIYERDRSGKPLYPITDPEYFSKRRKKCDALVKVWVGHSSGDGTRGHWKTVECGEPLYQEWRGKWLQPEQDAFGQLANPPEVRYPIAEYIKRNYPGLFELAVVDECFPADTPVATPRGPIPIRDLRVGDEVLSYKDGHIVTRRIVRTMHQASRGHLVRVTHTGGSFICTPNHKIYVDDQYIRADQLQPGDQLTALCTDVQRSQNTGEVIHGEDLPNLRPNVHVTTCLAVEHIDTDDEEVYNLEVEDTHCYFAAGVLVSNCHEMKGQSTDRGHAFGVLVQASKRVLAMTGTLFGGFATSLFYLLHRLDPRLADEFVWSDGQRFAALYGVLERITKHQPSSGDEDDYGHYTGLRRRGTRVIERPGISPALVTRLLDSTVFLTLEDLGLELPEYTEHPVILPMIRGDGAGPDQAEVYQDVHRRLLQAAREDWSLMSEYLQTTLSWPNACWRDEETSVGIFPALPADRFYPKERWLVDQCLEEKRQYRRVLLFVRQTATRDIQPRLAELLTKAGLKVVILRSSVGTRKREAWVNRRVQEGVDVLICNPRLVQTGLDLVEFPTSIFYEPEYSVYLIQQASRRTWRLGQTQRVKIYFAVYQGTMEHRAVAHVGKKVAAAQLLYGDDVAGALVSQAGVGGSFLEELAREVVANTAIPDLGELFVQKHQAVEGTCPGRAGQVQVSGWLLGDAAPVIVEREIAAAPQVSLVEVIPIDPRQSVQLTLF
jgi:predicted RNA-binding Zn-ribbon protein involved in translation (DUF1610 family)